MYNWLHRATDNKLPSKNSSESQNVYNPMEIKKCLNKYDPEYINFELTVINVAMNLGINVLSDL